MWHEARKQERKIRGMIVDYRKRAERRQDFYERIQADPTQFIQIHGRRCKIHLDPAVAAAGDGAAIIVPWHGHQDNLIDRFDVRAHLDFILPVVKTNDVDFTDLSHEERQCNYERYRILAQNDFLNLTEDKFLHQLYLEEQYGANAQLENERNLGRKKPPRGSGATIAYSYDDADTVGGSPQPFSHILNISQVPGQSFSNNEQRNNGDEESDSDIDMDVSIDISKLDTAQAHELNACGRNYGMAGNDFYSYLTKDVDEADAMRVAREEEQEKMLLSGRKSRRERRAQKERRVAGRPFSPPSYAAKEDLTGDNSKHQDGEETDSRSPSPLENAGKITYITSFGGEDELQPHSKISISLNSKPQNSVFGAGSTSSATQPTYAQKVKENLDKLKLFNQTSRSRHVVHTYSSRWSRSRSRSRCRRSRSRRSRSRRSRSRRSRSRHSRSRRSRSRRSRSRRCQRSRSGDRHNIYDRRRRSRSSSYRRRLKRYEKSSSLSRKRRHSSPSYSSSSSTTSSRSSNSSSFYGKNRSKSSRKYSQSRSKTPLKPQRLQTPIKQNETDKKYSIPITTSVPKVQVQDIVQYPQIASYPALAVEAVTTQPTTEKSKSHPEVLITTQEPPPPLKRYYGRKRAGEDSSDSSSENDTADNGIKDVKIDLKIRAESHSQDENEDTDAASSGYQNQTALTVANSPTDKLPSTIYNSGPCLSNSTETKSFGGGSAAIVGVSGCSTRKNLRERLKRKMQNLLNKQYKADKRAEIEKTERERQLQQEREDEMRELALKLRRRQRELRHKYGNTPNRSGSKSSETDSNQVAKPIAEKSSSRSRSKSSCSEKTRRLAIKNKEKIQNEIRGSVGRKSRSMSQERDKSRSRSRSNHRRSYQRRSRSRSRNRRSRSKRRKRSPSRSYRQEPSFERSRYDKARPDTRHRRSMSIHQRCRVSERDRQRERERDRQRERERDRRERDSRDRYRDRMYRNSPNRNNEANGARTFDSNSNRNRIVISAPPKLKKLVDY